MKARDCRCLWVRIPCELNRLGPTGDGQQQKTSSNCNDPIQSRKNKPDSIAEKFLARKTFEIRFILHIENRLGMLTAAAVHINCLTGSEPGSFIWPGGVVRIKFHGYDL